MMLTEANHQCHPLLALHMVIVIMILSQVDVQTVSSRTLDLLQQCNFPFRCNKKCQESSNISSCTNSSGECSCATSTCWRLHGSCVFACNETVLSECLVCIRNSPENVCDKRCAGVCIDSTCEYVQNTTSCQGCVPGHYGQNCSRSCSHSCNGNCYRDTGYCKTCELRRHGQECEKICPERCRTCSSQNGSCLMCMDGYTGKTCSRACVGGFYGTHCSERCSENCVNSCNHITGFCLNGCRPGFFGRPCLKICPSGTYGQDCIAECPVTCASGTTCHHVNGSCVQGCRAGFHGDQCDIMCSLGTYGENCSKNCSQNCLFSVCNRFSGHCQICQTGREGVFCEKLMTAEHFRVDEDTVSPTQTILIFLALFVMGFLTWWFLGMFMHYKQKLIRKRIDRTGKLPRRWASLVHVYPEYFNYPVFRQGYYVSRAIFNSSRRKKQQLLKGRTHKECERSISDDNREKRLLQELYKKMKSELEEHDRKWTVESGYKELLGAGCPTDIHLSGGTVHDVENVKEEKVQEGYDFNNVLKGKNKSVHRHNVVNESSAESKDQTTSNKIKCVRSQDEIYKDGSLAEFKGIHQLTQDGAGDTASRTVLDKTNVSDVAHEWTRSSDKAYIGTMSSDRAHPGTTSSDVASEERICLDAAKERNMSSHTGRKERKSSQGALEDKVISDTAEDMSRSSDILGTAYMSSGCPACGKRCLCSLQRSHESRIAITIAKAFSGIPALGWDQLEATTKKMSTREKPMLASRGRSYTDSSLSIVKLTDELPKEKKTEDAGNMSELLLPTTGSRTSQRQRSSRSKRTRCVRDISSEAVPEAILEEASTTAHTEVETSEAIESISESSTATTVKEKTDSTTSTDSENSGSESPSSTLVSAGTTRSSVSSSDDLLGSSTIMTSFATNLTETSSEGLSSERTTLPSFRLPNFQAALERQSQHPLAKTDILQNYDNFNIDDMGSTLPGRYAAGIDVKRNKQSGLFQKSYRGLVGAVNKLLKLNRQPREETDMKTDMMASSSSPVPQWPSSSQFLIYRLEEWRRSREHQRELDVDNENREKLGLSSSLLDTTRQERTSTAETLTERSSAMTNTKWTSTQTKDRSSRTASSEAETSTLTSSHEMSASTSSRSSQSSASAATVTNSDTEDTSTEKENTWTDQSASVATRSSFLYPRVSGSTTHYPQPYMPKYSMDSSTKSHS